MRLKANRSVRSDGAFPRRRHFWPELAARQPDRYITVCRQGSVRSNEGQLGRDTSHIGRRCERAVITAYRDLRGHGTADLDAFRACTTLYRIHHPEASLNEARRLVAEWIDHHVVRGDRGPTPGCDCGD